MNKKNNILEITNELNQRVNDEPLKVLSEKDWNFWRQNGYVIIHNAIPKEYIDRTVDLIWEFEEKSLTIRQLGTRLLVEKLK